MSNQFYPISSTCQIPNLSKIYESIFGQTNNGLFVEVGAFDGEYVSNTSGLADIGWQGYYIEPVPDHFERCRSRHAANKVSVDRYAIGASEDEVSIHVGGPLSTIRTDSRDNFLALDWAKGCFAEQQIVTAPQVTLQKYLTEKNIRKNFELLVIDVEGYEWEVLRNFDISQWNPKLVIIELHDKNDSYDFLKEECSEIVSYFERNEYQAAYKDHSNTIYRSWRNL